MSKQYSIASFPFVLAMLFFLITSCQFSKGVKKDLNTGLSASYNGLTIDDIFLADENGNKLSQNKVKLGAKVQVVATGVDYLLRRTAKYSPDAKLFSPITQKRNY
jgi:hypothetical protein